MKMQEALDIINTVKPGFMVSFEWCGDGFLRSDHFPEKGSDELIETEDLAWELAEMFAEATKGKSCNLYVIDSNFRPVPGYKRKYITNR